jgi:hypothetical protein
VVHAKQVEKAMEHQDPDFVFEPMAELAGLGAGAGEGDGKITKSVVSFAAATVKERSCSKREYIGYRILSPKGAVQPAQFGVGRDQAIEWAAGGHLDFECA